MQYLHDRRASGVRRVPVERVVDVCGSTDPASAFQGRSVDVSGRGIQIRSVYLPELRSPVVVRFQERGSEVIAEGEVTWRKVRASGGDFGVRFTALDSSSVQTLKVLCGAESVGLEEADADGDGDGEVQLADLEGVVVRESDHDTEPLQLAAGGVRLHIPGLATPMLAQVRGQGRQSVEVGSQLEFLRVGRSLEVEDLVRGGRRSAQIEAVDVMIDEHSRVPELLVSMRFASPSESPVPVPVRPAERSPAARGVSERGVSRSLEVARSTGGAGTSRGAPSVTAPTAAGASRGGVAVGATSTAAAAAKATNAASPAKSVATPAAAAATKAAPPPARKFSELETEDSEDGADDGADEMPPPKPSSSESAARASSDAALSTEGADKEAGEARSDLDLLREHLDGMLGNVSVAARAAGVHAARLGGAASRGTGWLVARARGALARSEQVAAPRRRTAAAPRSGLRNNSVRQSAPAAVQRKPAEETVAPRRSRAVVMGCVAALTTIGLLLATRRTSPPVKAPAAARVERAPVLPSANAPSSNEPARMVESPASPAASPTANEPDLLRNGSSAPQSQFHGAAAPRAEDVAESASESTRSGRAVAPESSVTSPAPKPRAAGPINDEFGQGRLTLPVIYRLKLDQAGGSLRGERTPTGFEVTIEGRRLLDTPSSIGERDDRIAKVSTHNGSQGTRISVRFRRTIPGYKVRLRKDYVEFLISSS